MVVAPGPSMRVISWNILHGLVIPPVNQSNQLAALRTATSQVVANYQPDFICLQEVDYCQPRSELINQTKEIAQAAGLNNWAFLPAISGTPGEKWEKIKNLNSSIITDENEKLITKRGYGIGIATNRTITKLYTKQLGRSLIGLPLMIPNETGRGEKFIYVHDEPRVALIAQLEGGITIATTHLSFVPGVNIFQLNKLTRYLTKIPGHKIIAGDLNLPANIPSKLSKYSSLATTPTYPSWKEKIQFDYIMVEKKSLRENKVNSKFLMNADRPVISDHIPIGVEINFQ